MKFKKLISMIFLFQSLCSSSPCNPLEKRDIIFINILHVAIERAAATISYLNIFPEAYRVMMQSHKNILLKIKNPSCDTKEVKNSVNQITLFLDILDNMESVFYQFAHIFDGLYPILSVDEKEEWVCYKNKIKDEIIKQVCHFKFILHFLNNIIDFKHTRSYEQKRFLNQFSNTIDTFLSEYIFKYDRDFLYHFFYDNFDRLQDILQTSLGGLYGQFVEIWLVVEKVRYHFYIKLYNTLIESYFKTHGHLPDKIKYLSGEYYCDGVLSIVS
jgi:hypothetical protein